MKSPASLRSDSRLEAFEAFFAFVGHRLEPFQREIAVEAFSPRRELLVLLPRGNGKTTLFAALALFELLTTRRPAVYLAAASRDQAQIAFDMARSMALAREQIRRRVKATRRELRTDDGFVKVLAADAPKVHGLAPSLALVDELHAHRDHDLYLALRTAMLKIPDSKIVTISTAGIGGDSPLGRLRARAFAMPDVKRRGPRVDARGPNFALLEWRVPDDADIDDMAVVKQANPASWISEDGLREQREAVHELAFRRYHADQWTAAEAYWLPPGAWQQCADDFEIEPGERVFLGVDIGGERAASAIAIVTEDLRVQAEVFQGDRAVLEVVDRVRTLARELDVAELAFDPWRFQQAARELELDGMPVVEFPQSNARLIPASERLYSAIVEKRLRHRNDPALNEHVARAVAKDTPRGWRLDKAVARDQIDAVIAVAMAVERAEQQPAPVQLLGWL